jgi:hypothetical protein
MRAGKVVIANVEVSAANNGLVWQKLPGVQECEQGKRFECRSRTDEAPRSNLRVVDTQDPAGCHVDYDIGA